MLNITQEAVRALLKSDPTLAPQDRAQILSVLKSHGLATAVTDTAHKPPRLLRRSETAARLGCTIRQIDNLAREGILTRIILRGRKRAAGFREAEVNKLIEGGHP